VTYKLKITFLCLVLLNLLISRPLIAGDVERGAMFPGISVQDLQRRATRISGDSGAKYTVISFFADQTPKSIQLCRTLVQVSQKSNVRTVAVFINPGVAPTMLPYLQGGRVEMYQDIDNSCAKTLPLFVLPSTVVVDRSNHLTDVYVDVTASICKNLLELY